MIDTERSKWELKNEKNKVNIRWLITIVIGGYLVYLLQNNLGNEIGDTSLLNWYFIGTLISSVIIINLIISIYIFSCRKKKYGVLPWLKYFTMCLDFFVLSLILVPTGGDKSHFFVVYFIIIISNSLRYGMRLSIFGLIVFNLFYVGVLMYQYPDMIYSKTTPEQSTFQLQKEVLKIGVFWLVGIYTGYIARRYENLQGEVEKYQNLVARLLKQKDENQAL